MYILGQNLLIRRVWAEKAAAPMYSLHMGFGIGAFITPQLAKPFLVNDGSLSIDIVSNFTTMLNTTNNNYTTTNVNPSKARSQIEIPYSIAAFVVLVMGIINISINVYEKRRGRKQLFSKPRKPVLRTDQGQSLMVRLKRELRIFSPGSCTGGDKMVTGYLFEYQGPETMVQVLLASACFSTMTYVLLYIGAKRHGKRFDQNDSQHNY